eukprot:CAMPEP_0194574558 /NCGR_PEP_ID=MMETSP0292-20121207/10363_1 /TAXON_ID=39354 /ORGANISM="Heterosigma akashiwo, Strain CCMP2393" /LENGTH=66 /DNA_ID=CAMNT_0039426107 /DNA_START=188 /DNA_END=389 /DNA_ORIENTATION=+
MSTSQKAGVAVQVGEEGQRDHHGPQREQRQPAASPTLAAAAAAAAPRQQLRQQLRRAHKQEDARSK